MNLQALPFEEALSFWRSKIPLSPAQFDTLSDAYRARAFTVAGLANLDQIIAVQDSLENAIAEGLPFRDWQQGAAGIFEKAGWTGDTLYRLDTIYRTNIQSAYNAGRWAQAQEAKRFQPFGMYDAIDDERTRPSHAAHSGKVYLLDHPFWDRWWPPNGFNCRCRVITLSAADAEAMGLRIETRIPRRLPDQGFRANPGKVPFQADLSKYPVPLKEQFLVWLAQIGRAQGWDLAVLEQMLTARDGAELRRISETF